MWQSAFTAGPVRVTVGSIRIGHTRSGLASQAGSAATVSDSPLAVGVVWNDTARENPLALMLASLIHGAGRENWNVEPEYTSRPPRLGLNSRPGEVSTWKR